MITLTATEATNVLRAHGMRITVRRLIDGIQCGAYPFGRVVATGRTGRRTVEIFTEDLYKWLREKEVQHVPTGRG